MLAALMAVLPLMAMLRHHGSTCPGRELALARSDTAQLNHDTMRLQLWLNLVCAPKQKYPAKSGTQHRCPAPELHIGNDWGHKGLLPIPT